MNRRSLLKLVGLIAIPVPGLPIGHIERVWIACTYKGELVTEPLAVEFQWNAAMMIKIDKGHNFQTDGFAVLDHPESAPFRLHTCAPIFLLPGDTLDITWTFYKEAWRYFDQSDSSR